MKRTVAHYARRSVCIAINNKSTLEPDGQATGCNPVQVGSTPTGVS